MKSLRCAGMAGLVVGVALGIGVASDKPQLAAQPLLARPAGLFAIIGGELQPLEVRRADIEVEIVAGQALTTTTLVFRNPLQRELEGELVFPVPRGAAVSGFGLDIDGEIVDAVAVERQAARAAYGTHVANKVDPALFEWVRGDVFRMRVFPIAPLGERSVRVRYLSALTIGSNDGAHALELPIPTDIVRAARRVELKVFTTSATVPSEVNGLLRFASRNGQQVATASFEGQKMPDALIVRVPIVESGSAATSVREDGSRYFLVDDFPLVPEHPPAGPRPRRVGVVWDASLSRMAAQTEREVRLVEQWLSQLGNVDVELVVLREAAEPARRFAVRNGDVRAVAAALRALSYDGGTRLDLLPACPGCALQVLFTDGQTLFDESLPRLDGRPPLHVVGSAAAWRRGYLEEMTRATGGSYIDASTATNAEIVSALTQPRFSLLSVRAERGQIADVVIAGADASSGRASVSGRLLTPSADLILEYGFESGDAVTRRAINLRGDDQGELPALTWAARRTARLARLPRTNRPELQRLGLAFNLATPATSLLVLENVRQHLASGIAPARSRVALYDEFQQRRLDWDAWRDYGRTCGELVRADQLANEWKYYKLEASDQETGDESPDYERPATLGQGTGTITGRVITENDEGVGGAEVKIAGGCTRGSRLVTAADDGSYEARDLPEGIYEVTARSEGWSPEPRQTPVRPGGRHAIDVRLLVPCLCERALPVDYDAPPWDPQNDEERPDAASELQPWDPSSPYLAALTHAAPRDRYRTYLAQRASYSRSPAFYLDAADVFSTEGDHTLARRMWLNVVELDPDNVRLLRVAAHRLQAAGDLDLAIMLFERVTALLPSNPFARHDLARALTERADRRRMRLQRVDSRALEDYRSAFALHREVLNGRSEGSFEGPHADAVTDMNRILAILRRNRIAIDGALALDPRLAQPLETDIRVVLTWDDDAVELYQIVNEPENQRSRPMSDPGTDSMRIYASGYSPAEFILQKASAGTYTIKVSYDETEGRTLLGPTMARATIFTDFGRPTERVRYVTVRMIKDDETYVMGTVRR